jgi:hypothetical protein
VTRRKLKEPEFVSPIPAFKHYHAQDEQAQRIQEMENAGRLLAMTDEEYVNTSTYKSVSKYL